MPTLCITGANRGLGLEFVRQYVAEGWTVLACCRDPANAKALRAIGGAIALISLDVGDAAAIAALAGQVSAPVDLLINNAGVFTDDDDAGAGNPVDYAARWQKDFRINTVAPLLIAQALLPSLRRGAQKKIISISSRMSSLGRAKGGHTIYCSTKAALNMAMKNLALEVQPHGITVNVLHPGWVRTDMGGGKADLAPQEAVASMKKLIAGLDLAQSGKFFDYKGEELPW